MTHDDNEVGTAAHEAVRRMPFASIRNGSRSDCA